MLEPVWEWFVNLALYWQIPIVFVVFVAALWLFLFLSAYSYGLSWAIFHKRENMPTETLKKNHDDWWFFLKWIPRRINAFLNGPNPLHRYPKQLFGTNKRPFRKQAPDGSWPEQKDSLGRVIIQQDVPDAGTWCVSWPFHIAIHTKKGFLFAFGVRKDYYDGVYGYWTSPRIVGRSNK